MAKKKPAGKEEAKPTPERSEEEEKWVLPEGDIIKGTYQGAKPLEFVRKVADSLNGQNTTRIEFELRGVTAKSKDLDVLTQGLPDGALSKLAVESSNQLDFDQLAPTKRLIECTIPIPYCSDGYSAGKEMLKELEESLRGGGYDVIKADDSIKLRNITVGDVRGLMKGANRDYNLARTSPNRKFRVVDFALRPETAQDIDRILSTPQGKLATDVQLLLARLENNERERKEFELAWEDEFKKREAAERIIEAKGGAGVAKELGGLNQKLLDAERKLAESVELIAEAERQREQIRAQHDSLRKDAEAREEKHEEHASDLNARNEELIEEIRKLREEQRPIAAAQSPPQKPLTIDDLLKLLEKQAAELKKQPKGKDVAKALRDYAATMAPETVEDKKVQPITTQLSQPEPTAAPLKKGDYLTGVKLTLGSTPKMTAAQKCEAWLSKLGEKLKQGQYEFFRSDGKSGTTELRIHFGYGVMTTKDLDEIEFSLKVQGSRDDFRTPAETQLMKLVADLESRLESAPAQIEGKQAKKVEVTEPAPIVPARELTPPVVLKIPYDLGQVEKSIGELSDLMTQFASVGQRYFSASTTRTHTVNSVEMQKVRGKIVKIVKGLAPLNDALLPFCEVKMDADCVLSAVVSGSGASVEKCNEITKELREQYKFSASQLVWYMAMTPSALPELHVHAQGGFLKKSQLEQLAKSQGLEVRYELTPTESQLLRRVEVLKAQWVPPASAQAEPTVAPAVDNAQITGLQVKVEELTAKVTEHRSELERAKQGYDANLEAANSTIKTAQGVIKRLNDAAAQVASRETELSSRITALAAERDKAQGEYRSLEARYGELERVDKDRAKEFGDTKSALSQAQGALKVRDGEIVTLRADIATQASQLKDTKKAVDDQAGEYIAAEDRAKEAAAQRDAATTGLKAVSAKVDDLTARISEMERERDELSKSLASRKDEADKAQEAARAAERQVTELNQKISALDDYYNSLTAAVQQIAGIVGPFGITPIEPMKKAGDYGANGAGQQIKPPIDPHSLLREGELLEEEAVALFLVGITDAERYKANARPALRQSLVDTRPEVEGDESSLHHLIYSAERIERERARRIFKSDVGLIVSEIPLEPYDRVLARFHGGSERALALLVQQGKVEVYTMIKDGKKIVPLVDGSKLISVDGLEKELRKD